MKTCINPECGREFVPGHYGDRQMTCQSTGCQKWYKKNWEFVSGISRGVPDAVMKKVLRKSDRLIVSTLILTARHSGMRRGELIGLRWADVLDGKRKIKGTTTLLHQWDDKAKRLKPLKTKRPRHVYFLQEAKDALLKFMENQKIDRGARIFPITGTTAYRWWISLQKKARVVNPETGHPYRFHDIRHALGLELVLAGKIHLAQKALGHANIDTTMKYAEQRPEDVLAELEAVRRPK